MTIEEQRQAIREETGNLIRRAMDGDCPTAEMPKTCDMSCHDCWAQYNLAFLTEKGGVLKVEGALPEVDDAYKDFGGNDSIWEDSQQAMVDAGYARTAPLIEPEKPH